MTFLEISLPLAERGFRVFPLVPKDKRPVKLSSGDHFDGATTDVAALELWSTEIPNANVGLCPDENFCFLETDDEAALGAECSDIPSEVWDTTRVSARDNRCYYIFRQTMRTRKAGNMTVTREGEENLFEFKQHRVYVTGPGSIHPTTGKPYGVDWRIIPAMPDVLLNRLCELYGAPRASEANRMDSETTRQTALLDSFLQIYEVASEGDWFNKGDQWLLAVSCPWKDEHENSNEGTSACIFYHEGGGYGFKCRHRCEGKGRGWKEFRAEVQGRFSDRKFSFVEPTAEVSIPKTAPLNSAPLRLYHADLAKDFLSGNQDFYRVYDMPGQPLATWRQTRWVISDDTGLLRSAVRDYLDRLYESLPYKYEKGRPDYRAKLKSAAFCRDVTAEILIKIPPIKHDAFDRNEYLLCLDGGFVAELKTATVRPVRREDFTSQRLYLAPDCSVPTPRFDRFMDEITLNNWELKGFLLRLMALCLTAHPYQGLFFFWGKGRNGKGVLLRLLSRILGKTFTCTFRPNELTASKYNEDKAMRSFNKLEGKRLATIDESVGSDLNLSVLKLMSGGDALSAAKMRQDERQFSPTHKNIFPTNEKPELPNDQAFQGRTFFVPFKADYSDRAKQDATLETKLSAEAPGILEQLISLCPDVIANGLRPPAIVLDATSELLQENDIATQFREDMLVDTVANNVALADMESAVQKWLNGGTGGLTVRASHYAGGIDRVIAGLKVKYEYKRIRPEGKQGRRVYHFLDVALRENVE